MLATQVHVSCLLPCRDEVYRNKGKLDQIRKHRKKTIPSKDQPYIFVVVLTIFEQLQDHQALQRIEHTAAKHLHHEG